MININVETQAERKSTAAKVLTQLSNTIDSLDKKTARTLLYWLNEWSLDVLPNEKNFRYRSLMRYKRGMIVQANFGFKVGSEQGGLHYALVIENNNDKSSKVVTVIPLGSLDKNEDPTEIHHSEIFLGYGLFKDEIKKLKLEIKLLKNELKKSSLTGTSKIRKEKVLEDKVKKMNKFSKGTIALVSQICAMSKMRIKTPRYTGDELQSFTLSKSKLNSIDRVLRNMYTKGKSEKLIHDKTLTIV